jgi:preprotein translocase subunit SecD
MSVLLSLPLLATVQLSQVETPAATCKLFLYPVNENGQVGETPIITPSQISSLDFQGADAMPGFKRWRVTLTTEGASANEAYSKAHIGEKIAIFCGSKEVSRPTIAGQSSGTFVIEWADKSP